MALNYDTSDDLSDDECEVVSNPRLLEQQPPSGPTTPPSVPPVPTSAPTTTTTLGVSTKQLTSLVEYTFNSIVIDVTVLVATIVYLAYEWFSDVRKLQIEYAISEM